MTRLWPASLSFLVAWDDVTVLYRKTNVDDNFPRRIDYFVKDYLGVVDISLSLKVVLCCGIRTSNLFKKENIPFHS